MQYCWSRAKDGHDRITPILIAMIVVFIVACRNSFEYMLTAPAVLILSYVAYVSARSYRINESGLVLRYPFGREKLYPWDQLHEVALCKVHYASGSDKHIPAIRCVLRAEAESPRNAKTARESWQSLSYEFLHHKTVVSIYDTPERFAEFQRLCPHEIADYRDLKER